MGDSSPTDGRPPAPPPRPTTATAVPEPFGGPFAELPPLSPAGSLVVYLAQAAVFLTAIILTDPTPFLAALMPDNPSSQSIALLRTLGPDPVTQAFASILVLAVHWVAFARANPRLVGLMLNALLMPLYYHPALTFYAVLWVGAAALGGGVGAWLGMRKTREEDFFFLVPAAVVAAYAMLIWLAEGCRILEPLLVGKEWVIAQLEYVARQMPAADGSPETFLERLFAPSPRQEAFKILGLWVLMLWMVGRLARRISRRLDHRRATLILFHIDRRYIFLLICSLGFWILGILTGRETSAMVVSGPILTAFSIACFLDGLAVVTFYLALWRAAAPSFVHRIALLLLLLAFLFAGRGALAVCVLAGLFDIWFDFRRVKVVEQRLGIDS
jgi:hypothetical protein